MADAEILYPKATAVWLIDNTGLTFDQVADFCGLHPLEVKGIADGDVAASVMGADPVGNGQLTREEIEKAEGDADYRMVAKKSKHAELLTKKGKKTPRYTPLSRRQERPNAIAWMVKNHPEVPVSQIAKLIGTTKTTIEAVRNRTHHNAANIQPQDPVALGLCTQVELDAVVEKAAAKREKMLAEAQAGAAEGAALKPLEPMQSDMAPEAEPEPTFHIDQTPPQRTEEAVPDADSVFANLGGAGVSKSDEDEEDRP